MRPNRIIWLIMFILSLVSISFYGGTVSYGFFIILTTVPVVSILYILYVIICFRIYQRLDGRSLTANRRSDFYFTLQNEGLLAFSSIRIAFFSDYSTINGLDGATEYELAPRAGIRKQTHLICRYRGEYEVGVQRIIVSDFLRLFTVSYKNREPLRVRVAPAVITLSSLKTGVENISSSRDDRINVTEPDLLVREYIPGDDIRMIHWRASAASNKLMVRQLAGWLRQGVAIIMDPVRQSSDPSVYLPLENKMLELVIALTLYYIRKNIPAGVICGSYTGNIDDVSDFDAFYAAMCAFDFSEDADIVGATSAPILSDKKDVCCITPAWDEKATELSRQFRGRGMSVLVYVIGNMTSSYPESAGDNIIHIDVNADLAEVLE